MSGPVEYNFARYLAAKKSVDDRALNQLVWRQLAHELSARQTQPPARPLQILEVGAGIGTMVERLLDTSLLSNSRYTAIDASADNIRTASSRLPGLAGQRGFAVSSPQPQKLAGPRPEGSRDYVYHLLRSRQDDKQPQNINLELKPADLFDFVELTTNHGQTDLLIAHAFMDLVDARRTLDRFKQVLAPQALLYLTINFDGESILEPVISHQLDSKIFQLYHQTMDGRVINGAPSGDSRTGRHLFSFLPETGYEIIAAGSSDWVVYPSRQGYPGDEAFFLHFIVNTIHSALCDHVELDQDYFMRWIQLRHDQIDDHELTYIAHQLDFLAKWVE